MENFSERVNKIKSNFSESYKNNYKIFRLLLNGFIKNLYNIIPEVRYGDYEIRSIIHEASDPEHFKYEQRPKDNTYSDVSRYGSDYDECFIEAGKLLNQDYKTLEIIDDSNNIDLLSKLFYRHKDQILNWKSKEKPLLIKDECGDIILFVDRGQSEDYYFAIAAGPTIDLLSK